MTTHAVVEHFDILEQIGNRLLSRPIALPMYPEDTIRFYALRLHEVGMIKNTAQKLIAQGTDWRFLNELKKELKA
jgi:hypothetical protein